MKKSKIKKSWESQKSSAETTVFISVRGKGESFDPRLFKLNNLANSQLDVLQFDKY